MDNQDQSDQDESGESPGAGPQENPAPAKGNSPDADSEENSAPGATKPKKQRVKKNSAARPVETYQHNDKQRTNNPPVGLTRMGTEPPAPPKKTYQYDPNIDPQLQWASKAEHAQIDIPSVALHVHERIEPMSIIAAVRKYDTNPPKPEQMGLFDTPGENPRLAEALQFYRHAHGWSNRLIAGDSLLVMNSLLEKEAFAGKVQMIYMDPPYGIRYGSNFQPFVHKRDVQDRKDDDLTSEPEQIKAFRDTWELGIHSYLTYLRDRFLLARELLTDSGSIFVQISDENVHLVRCLLDEVFGAENFCLMINYQKTGGMPGKLISPTVDYILWYAKDKQQTKFHSLYLPRTTGDTNLDRYDYIELEDKTECRLIPDEIAGIVPLPKGRRFQLVALFSDGASQQGNVLFTFHGKTYQPAPGKHWTTTLQGLENLARQGRIKAANTVLRYKRYVDDFPVVHLTDRWDSVQLGTSKLYVVQTSTLAIQRCLLMTTDPGDLVLDPTCGSGTTAYVAEKWGRRWITCDTSRVALTIARQRLITAYFDYYELAHPEIGIGAGLKYKTVPHITLGSIANNEPPAQEILYDQPLIDPKRARVTGPFTVEAVPAPIVKSIDEILANLPPSTKPPNFKPILDTESSTAYTNLPPFDTNSPATNININLSPADTNLSPADTRTSAQLASVQPHVNLSPADANLSPADTRTSAQLASVQPELRNDISREEEILRQANWRERLLNSGIRAKANQFIRFAKLEPLTGFPFLHAIGETMPSNEGADVVNEKAPAYTPCRVIVAFGPAYAPFDRNRIQSALDSAEKIRPKPDIIIFAGFQFSAEAGKDIAETVWQGVTLLKVQIDADLLTGEYKQQPRTKPGTLDTSFWLIGQPEVQVEPITKPGRHQGKYQVQIKGFDYFNTKTGNVESGSVEKIAVWLLDTDYDGRSLFPRQVFFPQAGKNEGWNKLARNLKAEIDEDLIHQYGGTVSLPFTPGKWRRVAVKIVDDRGIESMKVVEISK